jgi:Uma2 family endonuclease
VGTATKLATFAELLALPEDARAEVVGGAVRSLPSPLPEHARAQRALARFIGGPFDDDDGRGGPGGWWILIEVDVELGLHDVVRPDLAGWRRRRLVDPWGKRPIRVVPDWVCEVLSPSTQRHDRVTKADLYRAHGIPHLWLVDPAEGVLEALALDSGHWIRLGAWDAGARVRIPPFEDVELEVGRLFPPPG